jgi:hypothetical protein
LDLEIGPDITDRGNRTTLRDAPPRQSHTFLVFVEAGPSFCAASAAVCPIQLLARPGSNFDRAPLPGRSTSRALIGVLTYRAVAIT